MGKLPSEIWMSLLFVFWRLLCCCCFWMVVLPSPLCLRICTSLVLCWQSHWSVKSSLQQCAACSLLNTNNTSVHWWWRAIPGKGAGADFWYDNRAGSFSCFTLLFRPSEQFAICKIPQMIVLGERQNSGLFSWHARAHQSSFVLQAHSWAFSSPCPKPRTRIHPAVISNTTLSCFWLQPWTDVSWSNPAFVSWHAES